MRALAKTLPLVVVLASPAIARAAAPPTSFTVNSTADRVDAVPGNGTCRTAAGTCTLRAAIMEANALGSALTIVLPTGTYTLTIVGPAESDAATGDLDIRTDLIITSHGTVTIAGAAGWNDRIVQVFPEATVTMLGLRMLGGDASGNGGAILNQGTLTLNNVVAARNSATGRGGGIHNSGTLTLTSASRVTESSADNGGGLSNASGGTMTLSFVRVDGNQASENGGGILNFGALTVNNASRIINNVAVAGDGGGISSSGPDASLTLTESTVDGNRADSFGGGVASIVGDGAYALVVERSTISNNTAGPANTFGGGGGLGFVCFLAFEVCNSKIIAVTNSTVSGNVATSEGGGIFVAVARAFLNNVTITGNTVSDPTPEDQGGGGGIRMKFGARLEFQNTILAVNTASSGPDCLTRDPDGSGSSTLFSFRFNLIQNTDDCAIVGFTTGNITGQAPGLGPLADNGGPTLTHALLDDSPALDAASGAIPGSGGSACALVDQRGFTRPLDGDLDPRRIRRCDIGAVERTLGDIIGIGFSIVHPETAEIRARERVTYTLTWIVPAALRGWRALDTLELRLRDEEGTIFWLRFEEATNTFSLFNEAKGDFGAAFQPGSPNRLQTSFATLYLSDSRVDGPPGLQVTLSLVVTFKARAAGRTYDVEVLATDDAGNQDGFTLKGQLRVTAPER